MTITTTPRRLSTRRLLLRSTAAVAATGLLGASLVACGGEQDTDAETEPTVSETTSSATESEGADNGTFTADRSYTKQTEVLKVRDGGDIRGLEVNPADLNPVGDLSASGGLTAYISSVDPDVPGRIVSVNNIGDTEDIAELPMDELIMKRTLGQFDEGELATASLKAPLTHVVDSDGNQTDEIRAVDGNGIGVEVDSTGAATMTEDRALSGQWAPSRADRGVFGAADMGGYVAISTDEGIEFGTDGDDPAPFDHESTRAVLDGEELEVTELDAAGEDTVIAVVKGVADESRPQLVTIDLSADPADGDTVTETFAVPGLWEWDDPQITGVALQDQDVSAAWLSLKDHDGLYKIELGE